MEQVIARTRRCRQKGLLARIRAAFALRRQRNRLRALDDRLLDDIGLPRDDAEREATRPIWDVPARWRS